MSTTPAFRRHRFATSDGRGDLIVALPRVRTPVLVRPGQAVQLYDQLSSVGVVERVTAARYHVRGERGELVSLRWGEVVLIDAKPDPRFID